MFALGTIFFYYEQKKRSRILRHFLFLHEFYVKRHKTLFCKYIFYSIEGRNSCGCNTFNMFTCVKHGSTLVHPYQTFLCRVLTYMYVLSFHSIFQFIITLSGCVQLGPKLYYL